MAKKKTSKKQVKPIVDRIDDSVLPQNIISMGERVEENKNIYIRQRRLEIFIKPAHEEEYQI